MNCRFCQAPIRRTFVDLGMAPPSNSYVKPENANKAERFYPLHAYVCEKCKLVQLDEFEAPEAIFGEYAYFSSGSEVWLKHARNYAGRMIDRFGLNHSSLVVEIASNDGYLLRWFKAAGIPVLGVDPAANVVAVAQKSGIPTEVMFFSAKTAKWLANQGIAADLVAANNVLAHVPDINDFVEGFRIILKPDGVATFEFPHLLKLIEQCQFDTIYHEHFSYLSLAVARRIFREHHLRVFDVEVLSTHGGSLRVYVTHARNTSQPTLPMVDAMCIHEMEAGLEDISSYDDFSRRVVHKKCEVLDFFINTQRQGKRVIGYGAAAKGNTLLNYCGIGPEFLPFVVDSTPYKQGLLLPGSHIPIRDPGVIAEDKPDYIFILPWNWRDEIVAKEISTVKHWGGQFVTAIPDFEFMGPA